MGFRRAQHSPSDAGQKACMRTTNDSGTDGAKRIRQKRLPLKTPLAVGYVKNNTTTGSVIKG